MAEFVDPWEDKPGFVDPAGDKPEFVDPAAEPSFLRKVADIPVQVGVGGLKGIVEGGKALGVDKLTAAIPRDQLGQAMGLGPALVASGYQAAKSLLGLAPKELTTPKSIAGQFTQGISRFMVGFMGGKKVMDATKIGSRLIKTMGAGAIADYTMFGPDEKRLSNLVQSIPALQNPVTEFLEMKEDDPEVLSRIKTVLEGAGLGIGVEGVLKGIRFLKGARQARKVAIKETAKTVKKDEIKSVIDLTTDIQAAKSKTPKTLQKQIPLEGKIFAPRVRVEATEKAIDMTREALVGNRDQAKRVSQQVSELLEFGEIHPEYIPEILKKYNLTPAQFARELRETASFAGKTLNRYSQIAKQAGRYLGKDPEAKAILDELASKYEPKLIDQVLRGIRWVENKRRGFLVTQLTTAVRNTISQTGRMAISVFDEALQTVILGVRQPKNFSKMIMSDLNAAASVMGSLSRGKQHVTNLMTGQKMRQTLLDQVLDANPAVIAKARLFSQPVHEVMTKGKGLVYYLNIFNRTQEYFFRKLAFEAKLRQLMVRQGKNLATMDPKAIDSKSMEKAVDYALEMSFAASPKSKEFKSILRAYSEVGLTTINPFPRFAFANALPFIYHHSPLGYLGALRYTKYGRAALKKINVKDLAEEAPEQFAKAASRATLGTLAMWSAWQMRQSENAGEKWYEIKSGDKTYDMRSYAPLTTYLFFAEAIQDKIHGTNKIKVGDYAKMLIGLNRISGSGLVMVDLLRAEKKETANKIMTDFAGQYMGSWGVPIRTLRDVVAANSTEEAIIRDVKQSPLWAPFVNNIPFLSRVLPPATTPFREGIDIEQNVKPIRIDETTFKLLGVEGAPEVTGPIARQFFGITARVKNSLEIEVDKLDIRRARFFARTGDRVANRLINGYAGYLNEMLMVPLVSSPEWQALPEPVRRLQLEKNVKDIKQRATKIFAANHPELMLKLKFDRMDDDIKEIIGAFSIEELGRLQ